MRTIMAVAMVAMLAFGGTYAYFTATASEKTDTIKTGIIQVGSTLELTVDNVLPTEDIFDGATISVTSTKATRAEYVFMTITAEGLDLTVNVAGWTEVTGHTGVYYFLTTDEAPTAITAPTVSATIASTVNSESVDDTVGSLMGVDITVKLNVSAIQAEGFSDAKTAYEAL